MVKFGMIAGARNVVIFNRICSWQVRKVPLAALRVQSCVFRVGSWSDILRTVSDRSRIGDDVFTCFHQISVRCWVVILRARRSIW